MTAGASGFVIVLVVLVADLPADQVRPVDRRRQGQLPDLDRVGPDAGQPALRRRALLYTTVIICARRAGDRSADRRSASRCSSRSTRRSGWPTGRLRGRPARRHPVDHLRHLGVQRPGPAARAGAARAVPPRRASRCSRTRASCSGSLFDGGVVLAVMILPIITAISRDVFDRTPRANKEAALALGARPSGR